VQLNLYLHDKWRHLFHRRKFLCLKRTLIFEKLESECIIKGSVCSVDSKCPYTHNINIIGII